MTLSNIEGYGISFQTKVISALLTDKPFLQNINDVLTEEYFNNTAQKWIITEVLKYYQKFHTNPTMDVLKVEMKKVEKKKSVNKPYNWDDFDTNFYNIYW